MRWILERQEADGSWGGIQPPWIYSIIALHALGWPLDHPVIARALAGFDGTFALRDGDRLRIQACLSPVWDTCLAAVALADAGRARRRPGAALGVRVAALQGGHQDRRLAHRPAPGPRGRLVVRVRERVVPRHRRHGRGADRPAPRRPSALPPGRPAGRRVAAGHAEPQRRLGRLRRRQRPPRHDPASALRLRRGDRPAHRGRHRPRRRGARRVRRAPQRSGGAAAGWPTSGGRSAPTARGGAAGASTTSTARAPPCRPRGGRRGHGLPGRAPGGRLPVPGTRTRRGWGERVASYAEPEWIGRGESTASQTAWALLGLHAAAPDHPAVAGGLAHLTRTQRPDGSWDEGALHRHRLPHRLHDPLPPLPPGLPGERPRAAGPVTGALAQRGSPGRQAVRAHDENFPVAFLLLPPATCARTCHGLLVLPHDRRHRRRGTRRAGPAARRSTPGSTTCAARSVGEPGPAPGRRWPDDRPPRPPRRAPSGA